MYASWFQPGWLVVISRRSAQRVLGRSLSRSSPYFISTCCTMSEHFSLSHTGGVCVCAWCGSKTPFYYQVEDGWMDESAQRGSGRKIPRPAAKQARASERASLSVCCCPAGAAWAAWLIPSVRSILLLGSLTPTDSHECEWREVLISDNKRPRGLIKFSFGRWLTRRRDCARMRGNHQGLGKNNVKMLQTLVSLLMGMNA